MSGAEAFAVLGIIASIISIVEASQKLCEAARNEFGLHNSFKKIAEDIPLVLRTLQKVCQVQELALKEGMNGPGPDRQQALAATSQDIQPIVLACEKTARDLQQIFDNCIPKTGASRISRYSKAARSVIPGRQRTIEQMFKNILCKLQLLSQYQIFENAVASAEIDKIMERFRGVEQPVTGVLERAKRVPNGEYVAPPLHRTSSRASHENEGRTPSNEDRCEATYSNSGRNNIGNQGATMIYGGQSITF